MRGPRLFDQTDWKSKKRSLCPQMSCFHEKYRYREDQKEVYTSSYVLFYTESIGEEKRKVFIVGDAAPHFLRGPRFQLA